MRPPRPDRNILGPMPTLPEAEAALQAARARRAATEERIRQLQALDARIADAIGGHVASGDGEKELKLLRTQRATTRLDLEGNVASRPHLHAAGAAAGSALEDAPV